MVRKQNNSSSLIKKNKQDGGWGISKWSFRKSAKISRSPGETTDPKVLELLEQDKITQIREVKKSKISKISRISNILFKSFREAPVQNIEIQQILGEQNFSAWALESATKKPQLENII